MFTSAQTKPNSRKNELEFDLNGANSTDAKTQNASGSSQMSVQAPYAAS